MCVQYGNTEMVSLLLANGAKAERASNAGGWGLMDAVAFYNVFAEGGDIPFQLIKKGLLVTTIHQVRYTRSSTRVFLERWFLGEFRRLASATQAWSGSSWRTACVDPHKQSPPQCDWRG